MTQKIFANGTGQEVFVPFSVAGFLDAHKKLQETVGLNRWLRERAEQIMLSPIG